MLLAGLPGPACGRTSLRRKCCMRAKNSLVVCLVFGFSVLPPASATVINTYTSFTTWEAETAPGFTSIVFPGTTSTGNSLTLSGANFGTSGSEVFEVIDPTGTFLNYGAGLELEVVPSGSQSVLQITLPAGITSFGLNLTAFYNNPVTVTVNGTAYSV